MKLKALQSFSSPEGNIAKGQEFTASKERAEYLTENGYAENADPIVETPVLTKK